MSNYVKRYEPKIVQNNDEMNNIYGVHKEEIENLHGSIDLIRLNVYVQSMDIQQLLLLLVRKLCKKIILHKNKCVRKLTNIRLQKD